MFPKKNLQILIDIGEIFPMPFSEFENPILIRSYK